MAKPFFVQKLEYPRGAFDDGRIVGDVFCDHRPGVNNAILADRNTWANNRTNANPGILFDGHFLKIIKIAIFNKNQRDD